MWIETIEGRSIPAIKSQVSKPRFVDGQNCCTYHFDVAIHNCPPIVSLSLSFLISLLPLTRPLFVRLRNCSDENVDRRCTLVVPFRFRNELVPIRGITIKNIALTEIRGSISGCWSVSKIFPLQKERYLTESRPLGLLSLPALEHQIVDVLGGGGGPRQVIETVSRILLTTIFRIGVAAVSSMMQLPQALYHFLVGQMLVGDTSAEIQNLPEGDCESPHVALGRVLSLKVRYNVRYSSIYSTPDCGSRITNNFDTLQNAIWVESKSEQLTKNIDSQAIHRTGNGIVPSTL